MKRISYVFFVVMGYVFATNATSLEDRLEQAIRASDVPHVEYLIQESRKDAKVCRALILKMAPLAEELLAQRKQEISLVNNSGDFMKAGIGGLAGIACGYWVAVLGQDILQSNSRYEFLKRILLKPGPYLLVSGAVVGSYFAYKGFTCAAQQREVVKARKVKKLLTQEEPQT